LSDAPQHSTTRSAISAARKSAVILEESYYVITVDSEKERVVFRGDRFRQRAE
jgi:hypothetical protein